MMRLGFGARLFAIFLGSLVALQLVAVVAFVLQRSRATEGEFRLPLPDQAAALVELLERLPKEDWPKVLRAVNGAELSVHVAERPPATRAPDWYEAPVVDLVLRRYLRPLGDRTVKVRVEPASELLSGPLRMLAWVSPGSIEIEIGLTSGETLVIAASGVLTLSVFGLPPGVWAGLLALAIAAIALYLLRREARPLRELAHAVDRVPLGVDAPPIPDRPRSAPEIRALVAAFNRLTERIASLLKARMALVGGISHDLRTYVTRLRLRADLVADASERKKVVDDLDEMSRLLDDSLMAFSAGMRPHEEALVDVAAILAREVEDRRRQNAAITLDVSADAQAAEVLGDAVAVRRLFANLIDNATAYGEEARIAMLVTAADLIVTIDDRGPGIAAAERTAMLEPFARAENSRNRRTGGAGLGLAIARGVAESHGGSFTLADAPGGGLRACVTLPRFVVATIDEDQARSVLAKSSPT